MFAIWLSHHDDSDGAVRLRVQGFDAISGVTGIACAVEGRVWIVLLWLVLEYSDDFTPHVEAAIIIVAHSRGGDAVTGERQGCGDLEVVMKSADYVRCMPRRDSVAALQRDEACVAIASIFD